MTAAETRPAPSARVLVVDDDEVSRYMVERALESLGQRLILVETGEEALEWAAREDFAAIVLDIGLPGATGFDVARSLRALERSRRTPLLFVTGHGYTEALAAQVYATGASDLLFKPFSLEVLATKLRVFVELDLQRQRLEAQHQELLARTAALEESRDSLGRTRAERARLHTIFAQVPVGMLILRGPELMLELVNPMTCAHWGRCEQELVGRPFADVYPGHDHATLIPLLHRVLDTGEVHVGREVPFRVPGAQGTPETLFLDVSLVPLRGGPEEPALIVVAVDVTPGVLARRRTETVQAELEAIFQSIPDAVFVGSLEGIKRANRNALEFMGFSSMEALNGHLGELYTRMRVRWPDSGEPVSPEHTGFTRALAGESGARDYLVYHSGLGRDVRLRSAASPVWLEGRVAAAVVINTDVTERHAIEESLRRSEQELRTLAESLPQAVWTTSAEGTLTYANSALVRYSGLTPEALREHGLPRLLAPDGRDEALALLSHHRAAGEPYECELGWVRADGASRWHLVRVVPLRSSTGEVVRWLGTATDVHDLREAEAEAQRRADFEQQLIGIVSHDLRNPLSAILLGTTALARRPGLDDPSLKALLRIRSSAERATRMIRDLLDFTQARLGGGIPIQRRGVDLHLITRAVLDEVEATHPGREVVPRLTGDAGGDWDADRIAQVVQNLLTNALRYSPVDTPVGVEVWGEEGWVGLSIHNRGPPIAPERFARLFEPLQRATADVDRSGRSVGLGLYIVEQIVRAHGGGVAVRSEAAEGTTFTVRLPRRALVS